MRQSQWRELRRKIEDCFVDDLDVDDVDELKKQIADLRQQLSKDSGHK
jgi:hypothetical protein